jgi:hypothetical protein
MVLEQWSPSPHSKGMGSGREGGEQGGSSAPVLSALPEVSLLSPSPKLSAVYLCNCTCHLPPVVYNLKIGSLEALARFKNHTSFTLPGFTMECAPHYPCEVREMSPSLGS